MPVTHFISAILTLEGDRIVALASREPTYTERAQQASAEHGGQAVVQYAQPYAPFNQAQPSNPACTDKFDGALDLLSERIRRAEITIGEPQPDTAPGAAVLPPVAATRSIFSEVERMEGQLLRLHYLSARVLDIGESLERILGAL